MKTCIFCNECSFLVGDAFHLEMFYCQNNICKQYIVRYDQLSNNDLWMFNLQISNIEYKILYNLSFQEIFCLHPNGKFIFNLKNPDNKLLITPKNFMLKMPILLNFL